MLSQKCMRKHSGILPALHFLLKSTTELSVISNRYFCQQSNLGRDVNDIIRLLYCFALDKCLYWAHRCFHVIDVDIRYFHMTTIIYCLAISEVFS